MRIKTLAAFATTLLLVALTLNVPAAAADQQSGIWKMDPAKSKYDPGPAAKSITVKIESEGDNIKLSSDGIDATGNPTHIEYTAKYDGKDYPVTGTDRYDAVTLKRINDRTTAATLKKGGKMVSSARRVVSKDGKAMTLTITGTNPKGQKTKSIAVYEKQ